MSVWRKAMNYLGLGPDDDFYEDDEPVERARPARSGSYGGDIEGSINVRPVGGQRPAREPNYGNVREMPVRDHVDTPSVSPRPKTGSAVRTVSPSRSSKPHTVVPRSFNDAQEVGDRFRDGHPVIVNLESVERDLSRRIIDFTSGLCYALGGRMERIANGVYLLTPSSGDGSDDDRHGSDDG